MKYVMMIILLSSGYVIDASMIHRSLEYIEPKAQAVARHSVPKVQNVDLPRIASDYWNDIKTGEDKFVDLITDHTRQYGYSPLGLLAEDIKVIEKWLKYFVGSSPVFESAHANLPLWLSTVYENKTLQVINSMNFNSEKYAFCGPINIRKSVVEYVFQSWNRSRFGHKKYVHYVKYSHDIPEVRPGLMTARAIDDSSNAYTTLEQQPKQQRIDDAIRAERLKYLQNRHNPEQQQQIPPQSFPSMSNTEGLQKEKVLMFTDIERLKEEIESALSDAQGIFQYIENLDWQDIRNQLTGQRDLVCTLDQNLQFIIVQATDMHNPQIIQKLRIVLQRNRDLKIILAFNDQETEVRGTPYFHITPFIRDLIIVGININSIGDNFFSKNQSFRKIDLSSLFQLRSIGDNFLKGCHEVHGINLSEFSQVEAIGNDFLADCTWLNSIINLHSLSKLQFIGNNFFYHCRSLMSINLSEWSQLRHIGDSFFEGCEKLSNVKLGILPQLRFIGEYFFASCVELENMDLSSLSGVRSIGKGFFASCFKLESIDLSLLSEVQSIGKYSFEDCMNLEHVKLTRNIYEKLIEQNSNFFDQFQKLSKNNLIVTG